MFFNFLIFYYLRNKKIFITDDNKNIFYLKFSWKKNKIIILKQIN